MKFSKLVLVISIISISIFSGCSRVPLEPKEISEQAKSFLPPSEGKAGLYVYRDSFVGQALKKDVFVDHKCLGETANGVFFYEELDGNKEHNISTESEFSANQISFRTDSGKNYFVRQYIKMGVFVGGADLERVDKKEAKETILKLDMATKGTCGSQ